LVSGACPGKTDICCVPPVKIPADFAGIVKIADGSQCAKTVFDGSRAPRAFLRGLSLSFAKTVCQPDRADVKLIGQSKVQNACKTCTDTLSFYGQIMKNGIGHSPIDGSDTVKQFYTLMVGLGMRESNGKYCTGRDGSMNFVQDYSAEAGLFQTSYGNIKAGRSPLLGQLYDQYTKSQAGCLNDIYKEGIICRDGNDKNWGNPGTEGLKWQQLSKTCPGFAAEYAAVLLRLNRKECGPLNTKTAQVVKGCFDMFDAVEKYVAANKNICQSIING